MARVAIPGTAFSLQPTGKHLKSMKRPNYLEFIRSLPCVVTGRWPVEAAHISFAAPEYGKTGRGKGQKEDDRWTLPMAQEEHRKSHSMNERNYWVSVGIDPCVVALALFGAFPNEELARLVIQNARRNTSRTGEIL